jgi:hypothetical protein
MSGVVGPLPWIGSLDWSALCLINSFQGSPSGVRPLMNSLANSDALLGPGVNSLEGSPM